MAIREANQGEFEFGSSGEVLRIAGLFAGIGGMELGLHRAGHKTEILCENHPSAAAVLNDRFKGVPLHDDIRTLVELPNNIDLIAAGFPCQDLSQAGQTRGIVGSKSGLVSHVLRLLDNRPPKWVVLENVPFMLQLEKGEAMSFLVSEFEERGYSWAYRVVDSQSFGLPQRRQRVLFVASMTEDPKAVLFSVDAGTPPKQTEADAYGFYWTEGSRGVGMGYDVVPTLKGGSTIGIPSPPAVLMPTGDFVTPNIKDAERLQGFPADWTMPAEQAGKSSLRWHLVGNAVTVDVFAWLGEQLANPASQMADLPTEIRPLDSTGSWPKAAFGEAGNRFTVGCSMFPVRNRITKIRKFLKHETKPLSHRAASGFQRRLTQSTLRTPPGFREALSTYVDRMALPTT